MASMKDIKRRKTSIQSTQQITKAMKLVSTVRLQHAKIKAEKNHAYFTAMHKTVSSILAHSGAVFHPYVMPGKSERKAVVMITSNRGLAGGYNNNVIKLITRNEATVSWSKDQIDIYAIGTKGRDAFKRLGYNVVYDDSECIEEPLYSDAQKLCDVLLKEYASGNIGEIYVAYTEFKNTVVHIPMLEKVLPITTDPSADAKTDGDAPMNYELDEMDALDLIIPKCISSYIYGAMLEASASENGARMQAMDNATSNAEDMIQMLELQYNRARQGSITQELTEIIAGAEAIS